MPGVGLGLEPGLVALIAVVVVLGATVQNLVGLGLALVGAPVVTLLAPELMPQLLLVLAAVLPLLTLLDSHDDIDWRGLAWVLPARVPGTALGVLLLGWFSHRALGVAVGVMVLLAVLSSLRAVRLPSSPPMLLGAGFLAGVAGTTTSIGGPPVALLLQDRPPAQLRATLAVVFSVGALLSLAGIALTGGLEPATLLLAVALTPCLWVGTRLGVRLRAVLPAGATRYAVLALCAASALTLLVRSLV